VNGPIRELPFDEPGIKYVNWYRQVKTDYVGSETIEIIEPKGIKAEKSTFTVVCNKNEQASPTPTPSPPPG
jgi:hypothetical protein